VRAPDVHPVRADIRDAQPVQPHVAGAVEDGDCNPGVLGVRHGAAAVDREVGDPDVAALCDDDRPVPRPRARYDDGSRPGTDEPRAAPKSELTNLVPARGEANSDVSAAERRDGVSEAVSGPCSQD
jgi:hypothetical protein